MSQAKARAKHLAALGAALDADADKAPTAAILGLIEDGLGSLERIANALEKQNEPLTVGVADLKAFEPAVTPELAGRLTVALETIAAKLTEKG